MIVNKRCKYCNKEISNGNEFCGDKCFKQYNESIQLDQKKMIYFVCGIIIGFLGIIFSVLLDIILLEGISIMFMGMVVILLPYTTPETVKMFGYIHAKCIGRILGFLLEIVGIWIAFRR